MMLQRFLSNCDTDTLFLFKGTLRESSINGSMYIKENKIVLSSLQICHSFKIDGNSVCISTT